MSFDAASPTCVFEYGTVTFVADGDTLDVRLPGKTTDLRVRVTGVQAMELHTYSKYPAQRRGECYAAKATADLEGMLPIGSRVRLAAQDPSGRSGDRYRRSVAYVGADGTWQDAASRLLQLGDGLWIPNSTEYAWNRHYNYWAQNAAAAGTGLWSRAACGSGPNQGSNLQVHAQWDADGTDGVDLNGEYIRVRNANASTSVDLSGWWLRDSFLRDETAAFPRNKRGFIFPAGTVIKPGATVTLYGGMGTAGGGRFYWNQPGPIFENTTGAPLWSGDGAYLFDPQGDVRAWSTYACSTQRLCVDPLDGKVAVTGVTFDAAGDDAVNPNGEYVDIKVPAAGGAVDLYGYQLVNFPYVYDFGVGSVLNPGETMRVYVGSGTPSRLVRYWRKPSGIFNNGGEKVSLDNFRAHSLSCRAWGTVSC